MVTPVKGRASLVASAASSPVLRSLLVGIEDYTTFDATGATNLQGSLRSVALWEGLVDRLSAQVPPGPKVHVPNAKVGQLEEAFGALWTWLQQAGTEPRQGIFVYAGHGDTDAKQVLYLCPSDTTPGRTPGNRFDLLAQMSGDLPAGRSLTVVLDCCFSATPTGAVEDQDTDDFVHRALRLLTLRPDVARSAPFSGRLRRRLTNVKLPGGVVIVAAGNRTFERNGPSGAVGAFSEVATQSLSRWTAYASVTVDPTAEVRPSSAGFFDVRYRRWLASIDDVLERLDVPGEPLVAPPGAAFLAVFQDPDAPDVADAPFPTFRRPTARMGEIELNPGTTGLGIYSIDVEGPPGTWTRKGRVIATSSTGLPANFPPNTEFWDVDLTAMRGKNIRINLEAIGQNSRPDDPTFPDQWRVDTSRSDIASATGTIRADKQSWKLKTAAIPIMHIARADSYTEWVRPDANPIGSSTWTLLDSDVGYQNKLRTHDAHLLIDWPA